MRCILLSIGAALALLFAFLIHIGYFASNPFTSVPAVATPPASERGLAAVFISGDMGSRIGMGPKISERLAHHGIPVIAVNSLTYFRTRRTPEEAGALIADAMRRALALPGTTRVVLIGQSFGSDMLQVGLPSLPADLRAKVLMVALVVPGDTVYYRASPSELFNLTPPDASALPTARLLTWTPLTCIYGREEEASLCPMLDQPNLWRVGMPGGHMLNDDADALYANLSRAIAAAAAGAPLTDRPAAAPVPQRATK